MRFALALFGLLIAGASGVAAVPPTSSGMVDSMLEAMGGMRAWEDTRFLRFDWVVERDDKEIARVRHLWDRHGGRYRVEWTTREGRNVQSILDLGTREGTVRVDGSPASEEERVDLLETAYARYINDSYWLLMPWKLLDPGVRVTVEKSDGESTVLHVTFENVGLTPGDHYWVFVDPKTHLVQRWAYFLEDQEGEPSREKATAWQWDDWQWVEGLRFACDRRKLGTEGGPRILFPVVRVLHDVDHLVFESLDVELP